MSRIDYSPTDLDVMSRTLWGEARGEKTEGRIAVAWVIRNRLKRPKRFNTTIAGICQQRFQFSCWNLDDPNRAKLLALDTKDGAYKECEAVARMVLEGGTEDPTNGAQFYFNPSIPIPRWAVGHVACARIGHHIFFNDIA